MLTCLNTDLTKSRCLCSDVQKKPDIFGLMSLFRIQVVEEECNDWDTGFLVNDTISEKDLVIMEFDSDHKDEEMSAQTLGIVDNLFCKSTYLESVLELAEVERTCHSCKKYLVD